MKTTPKSNLNISPKTHFHKPIFQAKNLEQPKCSKQKKVQFFNKIQNKNIKKMKKKTPLKAYTVRILQTLLLI